MHFIDDLVETPQPCYIGLVLGSHSLCGVKSREWQALLCQTQAPLDSTQLKHKRFHNEKARGITDYFFHNYFPKKSKQILDRDASYVH